MPAATIPASSSEASSGLRRSRASRTAWPSLWSCGHDDDEPVRALVGELLEAVDELAARDGLVGHHERHVEGQAVALEVDDHVLDGQPRLVLERSDEVAPDPGRGLRRAAWRR